MATIRWSALWFGGASTERNLLCRRSASSVEIHLPARQVSSLTASPHRPHTQRPLNRSRTLATYAGVHSSEVKVLRRTAGMRPPFSSGARRRTRGGLWEQTASLEANPGCGGAWPQSGGPPSGLVAPPPNGSSCAARAPLLWRSTVQRGRFRPRRPRHIGRTLTAR